MAPVLDELAKDYAGRVKFAILDVERNKVVASHEGITGTPTLYFYRGGRLIDRLNGAVPKLEIARRLSSLLAAT